MANFRSKYSAETMSEVAALYKRGYSLAQVGILKGIPFSTVAWILKNLDVPRRRYGRWFELP